MKRRLLAALVCTILLMTLLPKTAQAGNATNVSIWGATLNSITCYYHNGVDGTMGYTDGIASGANATFDTSTTTTPTLTPNGLSALNSDATMNNSAYAIFADGDLAINVTAPSEVSTQDTGYVNSAIRVNGNLTLTGPAIFTPPLATVLALQAYMHRENLRSIAVRCVAWSNGQTLKKRATACTQRVPLPLMAARWKAAAEQ